MSNETMKAATAILELRGEVVTFEFPGQIWLERGGWIYVFGDANDLFGADAYPSREALEKGTPPADLIETPLSSDHDDAAEVASAVLAAVRQHQPRFFIFNETDGILAHPEAMTRAEADEFMIGFRRRFEKQGYYASASGRIPVAELRLKRIPEEEFNDEM